MDEEGEGKRGEESSQWHPAWQKSGWSLVLSPSAEHSAASSRCLISVCEWMTRYRKEPEDRVTVLSIKNNGQGLKQKFQPL